LSLEETDERKKNTPATSASPLRLAQVDGLIEELDSRKAQLCELSAKVGSELQQAEA
jgi:hypothetical protein